MADIPTGRPPSRLVIGTPSLGGPGALGTLTTSTSALANRAYAAPIFISSPVAINLFGWLNGNTASGNLDVGIYDESNNLVVSTGSIAHTGSLATQFQSVAPTMLGHGVYYLAVSFDNTSAHMQMYNKTIAVVAESFGLRQMSSAFPLPSVWVPEALTFARVPMLFAYGVGEVM